MSDAIKFLASFPPIQSAIKITGNGDGMRIQLDIPESEIPQAMYLMMLRECVLEVTIKRADERPKQEPDGQNTTVNRTTAKKRK